MITPDQLPRLRGSAACLAWAEHVRHERIGEMERYADTVVDRYAPYLSPTACMRLRRQIMRAFAPILAQTDAAYWLGLQPSREPNRHGASRSSVA